MKTKIWELLLDFFGIGGAIGISGLIISALVLIYIRYNRNKIETDYNRIKINIKKINVKDINKENEQVIIDLAGQYEAARDLRGDDLKEYILLKLNNELELATLKIILDQEKFVIRSRVTIGFIVAFLVILSFSFLNYGSVMDKTKNDTQSVIYILCQKLGLIKENDNIASSSLKLIKKTNYHIPEMVIITGGTYRIGISSRTVDSLVKVNYCSSKSFFSNEMPQKDIKVTDFYISKYEITVKQFNDFLKDTRQDTLNLEKRFSSDNQPAINVSWTHAIAYCRWLSEKTGNQFRLPYEIEWEVAAKGNTDNLYAWGNSMPDQNNCNFQYSFTNSTVANDKSPTNESVFHIFNMSGNVAEWCMDFYHADHYLRLKDRIIRELPESQNRVIRGGGFQDDKFYLRCTARFFAPANTKSNNIGFRIVSSNNLTKIKEDQK